MRRLFSVAAVLACTAGLGCVETHETTRWLRTTPHRTERLLGGQWRAISRDTATMRVSADRAVYVTDGGERMLTGVDGDLKALPCRGRLRATSDGQTIWCMEMPAFVEKPDVEVAITLYNLDREGSVRFSVATLLPANTVDAPFYPYFAGFSGTQPILAIRLDELPEDEVKRNAEGEALRRCMAWVLAEKVWSHPTTITTARWNRCGELDVWANRFARPDEGSALAPSP